jgi:acetyltransferase-like isoleucine patch superfamily enzyme
VINRLVVYCLRCFVRELRVAISRYKAVCSNPGVFVARTAVLSIDKSSFLRISRSVYIGDFTVINAESDRRSKTNTVSGVTIGDYTYIGPLNNIRAGGGVIQIGRKCLISQMVTIVASNHGVGISLPIMDQPWRTDRLSVNIGNDVWIGAGSTILPGVFIADGAIIAANSVVNKNVGKMEIFAGSPAKKIGIRK